MDNLKIPRTFSSMTYELREAPKPVELHELRAREAKLERLEKQVSTRKIEIAAEEYAKKMTEWVSSQEYEKQFIQDMLKTNDQRAEELDVKIAELYAYLRENPAP